jgi:hypothetical protein
VTDREGSYEVLQRKPGDFPAYRIQSVARGGEPVTILWVNREAMLEERLGRSPALGADGV